MQLISIFAVWTAKMRKQEPRAAPVWRLWYLLFIKSNNCFSEIWIYFRDFDFFHLHFLFYFPSSSVICWRCSVWKQAVRVCLLKNPPTYRLRQTKTLFQISSEHKIKYNKFTLHCILLQAARSFCLLLDLGVCADSTLWKRRPAETPASPADWMWLKANYPACHWGKWKISTTVSLPTERERTKKSALCD